MTSDRILGIDFGAATSAVAVWDDGTPTLVPNVDDAVHLPSSVAVTDEEIVAGPQVRDRAREIPEQTTHRYKETIGAPTPDVKLDGKPHSEVKLAAAVLRQLKRDANAYLDETVDRAVIGVPAHFGNLQRQALRDAASVAGLEVERLILESDAAALAYGRHTTSAKTVLVFDLGAGSLSISVLDLGGGVFEVLTTNGTTLGGREWDQAIVEWLAQEFTQGHGLDPREDPQTRYRLWQAAEDAKLALADQNQRQGQVEVTFTASVDDDELNFTRSLTTERFTSLTEDHVDQAIELVKQTLATGGLSPEDIDETLLVGGGGQLPTTAEALRELTDGHLVQAGDPMTTVVRGAAFEGGILSDRIDDQILLDVTARSCGVELGATTVQWIVQKNKTIPTEASTTVTLEDYGSSLQARIYQSDTDGETKHRLLDEFIVTDSSSNPDDPEKFEVSLEIDEVGMYTVHVENVATDVDTTTRTAPEGLGLSPASIDELRQDIAKNLKEYPPKQSAREAGTSSPGDSRDRAETEARKLPERVVDEATAIRADLRRARRASNGSPEVVKQGINMTVGDLDDLLDSLSEAGAGMIDGGPAAREPGDRLQTIRYRLTDLLATETTTSGDIQSTLEDALADLDAVLLWGNGSLIHPNPGADIDPHRHEIVADTEAEEPEGTVSQVEQAGYERAGTVQSPARVVVSNGPGGQPSVQDRQDAELSPFVPEPPAIDGIRFPAESRDAVHRDGGVDSYRAVTDEGRDVVVTIPRFELPLETAVIEGFERAATLWCELDRSDYVVNVVDWGTDPHPWIAVGDVGRDDVSQWFGTGEYPDAIRRATQLVQGVADVHRWNVAHRTLTPRRIHLPGTDTDGDHPQIADWGLGLLQSYHAPGMGDTAPRYVAPEQFAPDRYGSPDQRTDVYRLGAILYELVTGAPLFEGSRWAVMHDVLTTEPRLPTAVDSTLPESLDAILQRTLSKEKGQRYASATELLTAVREVQEP